MAATRHSSRSILAGVAAFALVALLLGGGEWLRSRQSRDQTPWAGRWATVFGGGACACVAAFLACRHCSALSASLEERRHERSRLEEALVEAEERHRAIFARSALPMALFDPATGEVVDGNLAACRSLGYRDREGLCCLRLATMVTEADATRISQHVANTMAQGEEMLEVQARTATGEHRDLRMDLRRLELRGKTFLLATWRDITEENIMREHILDQCQMLDTLIQTIPCPVFYKDITGKYTGCNRAFAELVGRPREEIIGKTVFDMGPREIAEEYFRRDRELFAHPGRQVYEWQVATPRGVRQVVFHKATFTDADGRVAGLVGVIMDVTGCI